MKQRLVELYLDYFNNFITIEAFATYYLLTVDDASRIVYLGRKINNRGK